MSPVSAKGSPACKKGETYRWRTWNNFSQGWRILGGSMLKGEVRCGTSLLDFSVLGSLREKSSDLVQMSPWPLSQGGRAPMQFKNKGVVGTSSSPDVYKRQVLECILYQM